MFFKKDGPKPPFHGKLIFVDRLNIIQNATKNGVLKPAGFINKGRTFNKIVHNDIVQVLSFWLGKSYRGDNNKLFLKIGIYVPESAQKTFSPIKVKGVIQEYHCNIRPSVLSLKGLTRYKGFNDYFFDLSKDKADRYVTEIKKIMGTIVFPMFENLNSRDKIISSRSRYLNADIFGHLAELDEAMIWGRKGDLEMARKKMQHYYDHSENRSNHLDYVEELAARMGIPLRTK